MQIAVIDTRPVQFLDQIHKVAANADRFADVRRPRLLGTPVERQPGPLPFVQRRARETLAHDERVVV